MCYEDAIPLRSLLSRCQFYAGNLVEILAAKAVLHREAFTLLFIGIIPFLLNWRFWFHSSLRDCGTCPNELHRIVSASEFNSLILVAVIAHTLVLGVRRAIRVSFGLKAMHLNHYLQEAVGQSRDGELPNRGLQSRLSTPDGYIDAV
jgi:hypothetical protein